MPKERRKNFRVEWNTAGKVVVNGRAVCSCIISNLSNGGANISDVVSAKIPDRFHLHFPEIMAPRPCRVSWRRDDEIGVQFLTLPKGKGAKESVRNTRARRAEPVA